MANVKISDITSLNATPANGDYFEIETAGGNSRKVTYSEVASGVVIPGAPILYSFDFAYDTPNLNAGIAVYTPAVGDVLLNWFVLVTEVFNGTTPYFDLGTFVGSSGEGWSRRWTGSLTEMLSLGASVAVSYGGTGLIFNDTPRPSAFAIQQAYALVNGITAGVGDPDQSFGWEGVFTATNPLKIAVSQDGTAGGTAVGGSAGEATFYFLIASPTTP